MTEATEWFEVIKYKEYLYIIRERLDKLEPRFFTMYINLYLILGGDSALLIDTGSGLFPLKPLVERLIGDKELIVVNTHSHFDHRGANEEFNQVMVHSLEFKTLSEPIDLSFLKNSSQEIINQYADKDFVLRPASIIKAVSDGHVFDLGDLSLKVIHTPGHSPGSISLLSSRNELYTGDSAHYGTMYLPTPQNFPILLASLNKMLNICESHNISELYPSHETFPAGKKLIESLITGISNIETIWGLKNYDEFLDAWILDDGNFKYIIEK